jgi:branched-chain amino acid aminotransferase
MINFNGTMLPNEANVLGANRGFLFGDAVFETLKVVNNKILFFEDHYFRLMASMRIVRMEIPMNFTLEFLEQSILDLVKTNQMVPAARVRMTVFRNGEGLYTPEDRSVSYIIQSTPLESVAYQMNSSSPYEVDLYKDFMVPKQLLSTIKTNNRMVNVLAGVFAKENNLNSCLLVNNEKNVIEALNGNIFMVMNNTLITPPISDGALNGIIRKQILALAKSLNDVEVVEKSISPFDLQKADELFVTNIIFGIQPITRYRKKEFVSVIATTLLEKLNQAINN